MTRLRLGRAAAPALFLTAGLLVVAGGASAQPGKDKDKGPENGLKEKGAKEKGLKKKAPGGKADQSLRKAFDALTELSQAPAGKATGGLLDAARGYYRAAVRAYPDDGPRAAELAAAANDAARGLGHLRKADLRPAPGLPEPPEPDRIAGPKGKDDFPQVGERGPWSAALFELNKAREVLSDAAPAGGAGAEFAAAAKSAFGQARSAYEAGDYRRAAELARAADAFAHVPEHLGRAGWDEPAGPRVAPEPRRKGAAPPPPPPPGRE